MKTCAVLITAFKSKQYILETIKSLDKCRLPNYWTKEIFIGIDGCLETLDFLIEHGYHCYYSQENVGTYVLTNSLINLALERNFDAFVRFDSDDIASDSFLYNGLSALESRNIIRASYRKFDNSGNYVGKNRAQGSYGCVFFDKKILEAVGGYRHYRVSCDKDFVLRAAHSGFSIAKIIPPALYFYRQHNSSLTIANALGKHSKARQQIEFEMNELLKNGQLKVENPVSTKLTLMTSQCPSPKF